MPLALGAMIGALSPQWDACAASQRGQGPDGAEPLIIQEGGEPTSKDDKPADKPGSGPAKERPRRPTANGPGHRTVLSGSYPTPLTAFLLRDVPARVSYTLTLVIPGSVKD